MDEPDVRAIAERARGAGRLGLDTEFLPEGRYRPLLCLVQVVVEDEVWVLDPLAGFDPAPLAAVLADPAVEVVVHAGRQDVAILRREWSTGVADVFDTQVAAGFAGFSAQAGYNGLLHDALKIRLPKTASFTRWDARPLTDEQLRYARGDVEHLLPLADHIRGRLEASGRVEWAREECRAVAQASDERDPEEVWRRLPRVAGLDPRERAVARELGAWRERTAERENRPVGAVLRDQTVVELAKRTPGGRKELAQIRGMNTDAVRRRGDDILAAIQRGRAAEPVRLDEGERLGVEPQDGPVIALAEALVRARAQEAGLAYELIAARADLTPIVVAARRGQPEPDVRTLRGWRRALVGAELLELLGGSRRLSVGPGGRISVEPSTAFARLHRGVGVVGEQPVDPEREELLVLGERVAVGGGVGRRAQLEREERVLVAERVRVHDQAGAMGVADERGRRQRIAARVARDDVVLRRADAVGVAGDLPQPGRRGEVAVRARVAADDEVVRAARARGEQLHERGVDPAVERLQVRDLERLHEHLRAAAVEVVALEDAHERLLERQPDRAEVGRVLGLGVDADRPVQLARQAAREVDDLLEGRHLVAAVVERVARPQLGDALLGAQRLELGEREVLGEPAGERDAVDRLRRAAARKLRVGGDVGRPGDLVLVPRHQHAVLGRDEIGLDVVRAHPGAERVGGERVLRSVAGGAAVGDHQRVGLGRLVGLAGGGGPGHGGGHDKREQCSECESRFHAPKRIARQRRAGEDCVDAGPAHWYNQLR